MLPCVCIIHEEKVHNDLFSNSASLQIVSTLIERLSGQSSVDCLTKFTAHERKEWCRALRAVGYPPLNQNLCTILIEKAFSVLVPSIRRFQREMSDGDARSVPEEDAQPRQRCGSASLAQLHCDFLVAHTLVVEWCVALRMRPAQSELATLLRCTLLQPDLLTGEEPPGKAGLVRFLYTYAHDLLAYCGSSHTRTSFRQSENQETSVNSIVHACAHRRCAGKIICSSCSTRGCHDTYEVFAYLHGLTLSTSLEIKTLWHGMLQQCIKDKIDALGDDFDQRSLRQCMAWGASVVEPFVHMALNLRTASNHAVRYTGPKTQVDVPADRCDGCGNAIIDRNKQCVGSSSNSSSTYSSMASDSHATAEALRAEQGEWCGRLRQEILLSYARKRLTMFWDLLIEYPDSIPVLEDMHYCLQHCLDDTLKRQLIYSVHHLLVSRLHRAGTRTDDIISVLNKSIHSLCVLLPRREQSTVILSVISDTLAHLRKRKDCVATIVKSLTQPKTTLSLFGDMPAVYFQAPHVAQTLNDTHTERGGSSRNGMSPGDGDGYSGEEDTDRDSDDVDWMSCHVVQQQQRLRGTGRAAATIAGSAARAQPDVLRVLLTAVSVKKLEQEYKHVLAGQLLSKPLHDFDVAEEEEVLERLKCVLGDDALASCGIMLHDIQNSRRVTQQIRDQMTKMRQSRAKDTSSKPCRSNDRGNRGRHPTPTLGFASYRQQQQHYAHEEGLEQHEHHHNNSSRALDDRNDESEGNSGDELQGRGSICLPQAAHPWMATLPTIHLVHTTAATCATSSSPPPRPSISAADVSVSILSMTAWPRETTLSHSTAESTQYIPETYVLHPDLQSEWDRLASAYRSLKASRKLLCLLSQGRVVLELEQRHLVMGGGECGGDDLDSHSMTARTASADRRFIWRPTSHTLTLFAASLVLHVQELVEKQHGQPVASKLLAQCMGVSVSVLASHISALVPAVLTQSEKGLAVQRDAVTTSNYVFDEAQDEQHDGADSSVQLSADQVKMIQLMTTAMLKTGGPKSLNDIFNSMKTFVKFQGTAADMKRLLQTFISDGTLIMKDATSYAVRT